MSRAIVIVSNEPPPEGLQLDEPAGFAVHWYVCMESDDPEDFQDVLDLCRKTRAAGLVAGSASVLPLVTWVGESLGLLGISVQVAQLMTDRALLLDRLRATGVPTIPFRAASTEEESIRAAQMLGEPVIVQAVEGAEGARSRYVQHFPEVGLAYRQVTRYTQSKRVLVTHPAGAVRRSVFCYVHKGDAKAAAVVDVSVDPRFMFPTQITAPARIDAALAEAYAELALRVVQAIRVTNGCLRIDVLESETGPQVSGVDMCPLSGWMPFDLLKLAGITDFHTGVLSVSAGDPPPPIHTATRAASIAWLHVATGEVTRIEGADAVAVQPDVHAVCVRIEPGDVVRHIVDQAGRDRVGFVVATGAEPAACAELARAAAASVTIRSRIAYDGAAPAEAE